MIARAAKTQFNRYRLVPRSSKYNYYACCQARCPSMTRPCTMVQ